MLEIKNLSKKFNDRYVLNNINLTIKPGTISILLGSSGVGKSSLLRILNDLETIDTGTILHNGKAFDLETIHKKHLIGLVFQHFSLFKHLSVKDNITVVLEKVLKYDSEKAQQKALELLKKFGLEEQANLSVNRLSGGQQQRLAIARALSVNPQILCMDEPTSALDPLLTQYIAQLIQNLAADGFALLIATHDMSLVKDLDCTIYLMRDGSIIETATSGQLKTNPQQFKQIYAFMQGAPKTM